MATSPKTAEGKVETLPKWAAARIRQLEGRLEDVERQLHEERGGRPDSPVQVAAITRSREYGLEPGATVRFSIGTRKRSDGSARDWIDVRLKDGQLLLMGSDTITAFFGASNVITVDIADRYELNERTPIRDLGERLMAELVAKGLNWQDGLNLITKADVAETKNLRLWGKDE